MSVLPQAPACVFQVPWSGDFDTAISSLLPAQPAPEAAAIPAWHSDHWPNGPVISGIWGRRDALPSPSTSSQFCSQKGVCAHALFMRSRAGTEGSSIAANNNEGEDSAHDPAVVVPDKTIILPPRADARSSLFGTVLFFLQAVAVACQDWLRRLLVVAIFMAWAPEVETRQRELRSLQRMLRVQPFAKSRADSCCILSVCQCFHKTIGKNQTKALDPEVAQADASSGTKRRQRRA